MKDKDKQMIDTNDDATLDFVKESIECLQDIEPGLFDLENDLENIDNDIVNQIFRSIHSIKTGADFFEFINISNIAKIMEELLSSILNEKLKPFPGLIDAFFEGTDLIRTMLDNIHSSNKLDISVEQKRLQVILNQSKQKNAIIDIDTDIDVKHETEQKTTINNETDNVVEGFVEESKEYLKAIECNLSDMDNDLQNIDNDAVKHISRSIYNIKSGADFFEYVNISALTNVMEELCSFILDGKIKPFPGLMDSFFEGVNVLKTMLNNVDASNKFDVSVELGRLQVILNQNQIEQSKDIDIEHETVQMIDIDEVIINFTEEAKEHLQTIESCMLEVKNDLENVDMDFINQAFRSVRNIKGGAGFFELIHISDLCSVMEELLSLVKSGKLKPFPQLVNVLFDATDALWKMVSHVNTSDQFDISVEREALQTIIDQSGIESKNISLKELAKPDNPDYQPKRFDLAEDEIKNAAKAGKFIYSLKVFFKDDLRKKNRTPFDFIKQLESMGDFIDTIFDIDSIGVLSDSLDSDLAFIFIYATILELDFLPKAFDLPKDRIAVIDNEELKKLRIPLSEQLTTKVQKSDNQAPLKVKSDLKHIDSTIQQKEPLSKKSSLKQTISQQLDIPSPDIPSPNIPSPNIPSPNISSTAITKKSPIKDTLVKTPVSAIIDNKPATSSVATVAVKSKAESKVKIKNPFSAGKKQIQAEEKIRVGVNFLNDLVNLAGELVLGRNQLMQVSLPLIKNTPRLNPVLQHISRITTEMQEKIMQMRMQPISTIFDKFNRVVRDLAKNLSKEIKLDIIGGDVELDKTIIEALSDPLTHLIRNSVDHGVELPDEREKSGKIRQGTIILKAFHQAGHVHIEIIDDGKGIDVKQVGKKAIEKSIITEDDLSSMSKKDVLKLILAPGFSTAEKVTSVSGRGVGMDVVLTNIKQLNGTIDIDTNIGKGTIMRLELPLTLAIVSGLATKSAGQLFIFPEANIEELVRIKPSEISKRIDTINNAQVLRLREMLLPLINLKQVLNIKNPDITKESVDIKEPVRILVTRFGTSHLGVIVDSLENIEEIVVKPLPRYLSKMKCYSGTSIMGNGAVALIMDVAGLSAKANLNNFQEIIDKNSDKDENISEQTIQTLLLFDNNTSERFAIPLELITRIERVSADKIERVKDNCFLQYQGKKLKLIFLEDYLPIIKPSRDKEDTVGVIIPKHINHDMGIVINNIIGAINTEVMLDTISIMAPGIFGSSIIDEKITLFPDMYSLFELASPDHKTCVDNDENKKTILLVEDTPFFRMVEAKYLEAAGYDVIQAENGKKAMLLLESNKVDGVILDIVMPEMDGWAVIKKIRSDVRFKDLPVMAVTSLSDKKLEKKGLEAGFTKWESKLNKTSLLEKLQIILS